MSNDAKANAGGTASDDVDLSLVSRYDAEFELYNQPFR